MAIYLGSTLIEKGSRIALAEQRPITSETLEESETQSPITVNDRDEDTHEPEIKTMTHRHWGHPVEHPITLRHRKVSADPNHGEEDKLIDEYKDLYERSGRGDCTTNEMRRLYDIKGRISEIQAARESDARSILSKEMGEAPSSHLTNLLKLSTDELPDDPDPMSTAGIPIKKAQPSSVAHFPGGADLTVKPLD